MNTDSIYYSSIGVYRRPSVVSPSRKESCHEYPETPLVGVGVVVILNGERVLLIQRANEPGRGIWAIPGGAVELGETLEQAALREVREECGLDVELGPLVDFYDLIVPDHQGRIRFHYVLLDFVARYRGGRQPLRPMRSRSPGCTWPSWSSCDMPERLREVVRKAMRTG